MIAWPLDLSGEEPLFGAFVHDGWRQRKIDKEGGKVGLSSGGPVGWVDGTLQWDIRLVSVSVRMCL